MIQPQPAPIVDTVHWNQDYFYSASVSGPADFPKQVGPIFVPKGLPRRRVYAGFRIVDTPTTLSATLVFSLLGNPILTLPFDYDQGATARTSRDFSVRLDSHYGTDPSNNRDPSELANLYLDSPSGNFTICPIFLKLACDSVQINITDAQPTSAPAGPAFIVLAVLSEGKQRL
jgi:hypothetical protein